MRHTKTVRSVDRKQNVKLCIIAAESICGDVIATLTMYALVSIIANYGPMIYTAPYVMLLMRVNPFRGKWGGGGEGGWVLEIKTFLDHGAQKS
jgi:hypothetical protein